MEPYDPTLIFKMRLPVNAQKELILGRLYLRHKQTSQHEYMATSGLAGKQFTGTQGLKGIGPLPSTNLVRPVQYTVSCAYTRMTVTGHQGAKFYPISPAIVRIGNVNRGDFGIHQDLNFPGTIGCIGIVDKEHWMLFTQNMAIYLDRGYKVLPLEVIYY